MNVWLLFSLMCAGIFAVGLWAGFSKTNDEKSLGEQKARYYFAQFYPREGGGYKVYFPDFPGLTASGASLDEAMTKASKALCASIKKSLKWGKELPAPSDFATAKAKALEADHQKAIPPEDGTLYLLVSGDPPAAPLVRADVSIQADLLDQIDRQAKEAGLSRSDLMAAAAIEYMQRREVA